MQPRRVVRPERPVRPKERAARQKLMLQHHCLGDEHPTGEPLGYLARREGRWVACWAEMDEILSVAPVRTRNRVCAVNNPPSRYLKRTLDKLRMRLDEPAHGREALLRVIGWGQGFALVSEICFKRQSSLRIDIRPAFRRQFQVIVGRAECVLDLRASGERRGTLCIAAGMHQRAQTLLLRFVLGRKDPGSEPGIRGELPREESPLDNRRIKSETRGEPDSQGVTYG